MTATATTVRRSTGFMAGKATGDMVSRLPRGVRSTWLLAILALALLPIMAIAVISTAGGNGSSPAAPTTVRDDAAASKTVGTFISATRSGNVDALYAIQEESYKEGCSRQGFDAVAVRFVGQQLEGPVSIEINGDSAQAGITEVGSDGSKSPAIVGLRRAKDGSWRIAAPVTGRCLP